MPSIIIMIDYFGKWPEWFPIFIESCKANPTITWLIHTDCPIESWTADNVIFRRISMQDYAERVSRKLEVNFDPRDSYKLCELKPMLGAIHEEEIRGYDFFGYGDLDVIYGDIRKFYTDEVLENNVVSTHEWCLSAHLALLRNTRAFRYAFRKCRKWKEILEAPVLMRFDEDIFTHVFKFPYFRIWSHFYLRDVLNPFSRYRKKLYFKEQFTTPLTPIPWRNEEAYHPTVWYWKDGRITDKLDGGREYIYLHFMNFKQARYMNPVYGNQAFWTNLPKLVHACPEDIPGGIMIDRYGFHAISPV